MRIDCPRILTPPLFANTASQRGETKPAELLPVREVPIHLCDPLNRHGRTCCGHPCAPRGGYQRARARRRPRGNRNSPGQGGNLPSQRQPSPMPASILTPSSAPGRPPRWARTRHPTAVCGHRDQRQFVILICKNWEKRSVSWDGPSEPRRGWHDQFHCIKCGHHQVLLPITEISKAEVTGLFPAVDLNNDIISLPAC